MEYLNLACNIVAWNYHSCHVSWNIRNPISNPFHVMWHRDTDTYQPQREPAQPFQQTLQAAYNSIPLLQPPHPLVEPLVALPTPNALLTQWREGRSSVVKNQTLHTKTWQTVVSQCHNMNWPSEKWWPLSCLTEWLKWLTATCRESSLDYFHGGF